MQDVPSQFALPPALPRREIDWGTIGEAFSLLFKNIGVYIVPGLLMTLLLVPYFVVALLPLFDLMGDRPPADPFASAGLQAVLFVGASLAWVFFYPGIVKYTFNVSRGLPASRNDVWEGFRDPLGYFAVGAVSDLIGLAGGLLCCIGVVVTTGLVMFAIPIKVDTGKPAWQCITESWELLKSHWLVASAYMLVLLIISQVGGNVCVIGMIVTIPFPYIAAALQYDRFMGRGKKADGPSPYERGVYPREQAFEPAPPSEVPAPPRPDELS